MIRGTSVECLDHFVLFGCRHLGHVVREYAAFYNTARPHRGIGNRPIGGARDLIHPTPMEWSARRGLVAYSGTTNGGRLEKKERSSGILALSDSFRIKALRGTEFCTGSTEMFDIWTCLALC